MKITRWLLSSLLAVFLVMTFTAPVLAIDDPDVISIEGVWVYRNCKETGDQLYIVSYAINYTSLPDETVSEAYLCRLMEGVEEQGMATPFAYYNKGYGDGVVALYFDSSSVPDWEGGYTMTLAGNPFVDWAGAPPSDSVSEFDLWQDNDIAVTKELVAARVVDLALDLEDSWGKDMVTVAEDTGQQVLTTYALGYFINVIPYFGDIAPSIWPEGEGMGSGIISPEVPPDDSGDDYASYLEGIIADTPFDLTDLADAWGVDRGPLTAFLYYGIVAFALIILARRLGSFKPVMVLAIPFVFLGAFVGVPLIVTILVGFVSLGLVAYVLFYRSSTA